MIMSMIDLTKSIKTPPFLNKDDAYYRLILFEFQYIPLQTEPAKRKAQA